jgi:hypothetical protein
VPEPTESGVIAYETDIPAINNRLRLKREVLKLQTWSRARSLDNPDT